MTLDGERAGELGVGSAGETTIQLNLKKGSNMLVALAENAGRVSSGADLGELTGIYGHAWEVEKISIPKPKLEPADPVDPLAFRAPLWKMHRDDRTEASEADHDSPSSASQMPPHTAPTTTARPLAM